jgi:transposase
LAADGVPNRQIGVMVDMHYNQVAVWRRRYAEPGLAGLGDEERPGRPFVYSHDDVLLLVKTVTEPPPDQATRWTMEALAAVMAAHGVPISASQIWRIWRGLDLKPWPVQSWMTSHDPDFWEKAADVCGLYLGPPTNAVVWSVDEKTSIQAKARVNPTVRAAPGRKERRELEYERNGTAVLFAGLKVHEGTVAGWVTGSTCSDNFVTTCTASSTTWPPIRPTKSKNSSISTPGPTCTTRLPTRRGSTKSSCFSPSWNVGYCAVERVLYALVSGAGRQPVLGHVIATSRDGPGPCSRPRQTRHGLPTNNRGKDRGGYFVGAPGRTGWRFCRALCRWAL